MRAVIRIAVVLAALASTARAVQLEALDPAVEWRVRAIRVRGHEALSRRELLEAMVTEARPWYAPWRPLPPLDPVAFRTDLERLRRLYRSRGHYEARVEHDVELPARGHDVTLVVYVEEGPPIQVRRVTVAFEGEELPEDARRRLREGLPIREGEVFTEDDYDAALSDLRSYYREHGYARVRVDKAAEVDVAAGSAVVAYRVESGPLSRFGDTLVRGVERVSPGVVRREVAWRPGDRFAQSRLDRTRDRLVALNLFRSVRLEEVEGDDPRVDVRVRVTEAPHREVRVGVGYDTEEQIRALASWRSYDFLGDARQLGFTLRASFIERTLIADFLQPHFPGRGNRTRLLFAQQEEDEDAYTLDRTRLSPRLEWGVVERLSGFVFHRLEYVGLRNVNRAVAAALPGAAPRDGILSGFGVGADWDRTDHALDPSRGWIAGLTFEPVGEVFGGDFAFWRALGQARAYRPLAAGLVGAGRVRLGTADPTDGTGEIPLFERFYAGGLNSVRGYARRRVGPLADDEPLGGRTLVELSAELRRPITETIGAVVFVDGGQVALRSFDFPLDDLQYGVGAGARYRSPVGPLRLDLAFPLDPRGDDARWQVHVSIGAAF